MNEKEILALSKPPDDDISKQDQMRGTVSLRVREQHRKWCYGQTNYAVSTSSANFLRA
jgi:hypothetical protein